MPLTPGSRFGPYEIQAPIGAGGMGQVYRARDTRLHRDAAIKVLPESFAADRDSIARLEREAQVLASLNHPHIAQVYGLEESDGVRAIAMELVPGETLAERLRRGAIGLNEALPLARQLADALDVAHQRGIVHRDLKPANIKVTPEAAIKVLDFGLAKAAPDDRTPAELSQSPTVTGIATRAGVILGTAAYMSPEQARGRVVDKRTDIWAFGCVFYEMLSGRSAFTGETVSDVIAAVLERDPDWNALPSTLPPHLRHLLAWCLAKDPQRRLRDIGDAAEHLTAATASEHHADRNRPRRQTAMVALAALALAGWAAAAVLLTRAPASPAAGGVDPIRFTVDTGGSQPALSADGRGLAWIARGGGGPPRIWIRMLDAPAARELPGTENATYPFWAPDRRALGFFADNKLKRIDLGTRAIQVLADTPEVSLGGTWSAEDVVLFSNRYGLYRMPASGGEKSLVVGIDRSRQENSLRQPQFLPDGRHFVFVSRSGRPDRNGAYVSSLDGQPKRLFDTLSSVAFAPPGYLLFVRGAALVAQPFDAATLTLGAPAVPIAENVAVNPIGVSGLFAVSAAGVLAYVPARTRPLETLQWVDRSGSAQEVIGNVADYDQLRIAPDGRRVAAAIADEDAGTRSLWILDQGKPPARLTFTGTHDWEPVWSPDGQRIAFGSYRDGPLNIYLKAADGSGSDQPLVATGDQKDLGDFSPDGEHLVYRGTQDDPRGDIVYVAVAAPQQSLPIARTPATERFPRFSGDGRWVSYVSDESGRDEVYVQPFPPTGAKFQVSIAGGTEPSWRRDGGELFYVDPARNLMSVPLRAAGASVQHQTPRPLFHLAHRGGQAEFTYDAAPSGLRFLVVVPGPAPPPVETQVVINWHGLLNPRR